jgi:hypothetical protein
MRRYDHFNYFIRSRKFARPNSMHPISAMRCEYSFMRYARFVEVNALHWHDGQTAAFSYSTAYDNSVRIVFPTAKITLPSVEQNAF